jgi:Protein of unknown function (DUF3307)
MFNSIFILLAILFVKHWYIDFVVQTDDEIKHKGTYGNWIGFKHSLKHGIVTFFILVLATEDIILALELGLIDLAIHYHVDWIKMSYGNRNVKSKEFWSQLGFDQLAHSLTYIFIAWLIF